MFFIIDTPKSIDIDKFLLYNKIKLDTERRQVICPVSRSRSAGWSPFIRSALFVDTSSSLSCYVLDELDDFVFLPAFTP